MTKAKTSITVDDHLHARVRDPKGECLEEGTQGDKLRKVRVDSMIVLT